jgi:trans-aconitate methyltransferase
MKYPQSLFTKKIKRLLPEGTKSIIDAPCGSGLTTYELSRFFPAAKVTGVDISKKDISFANKKYTSSNLNYLEKDIHSFIDETEKIEVFCLINSLFLLPEPERLLRKISQKLNEKGQLFLILPNPESINFKRYQKIFRHLSFQLESS